MKNTKKSGPLSGKRFSPTSDRSGGHGPRAAGKTRDASHEKGRERDSRSDPRRAPSGAHPAPKHEKRGDKGGNRPRPATTTPRPSGHNGGRVYESKSRDSVLLWGFHAVAAAWTNPDRVCYRLWATDSAQESLAGAIASAREAGLARPNAKTCTRADIDALLPADTVHQGIALEAAPLDPPSLEQFLGTDDLAADLVVVLDQVTDPHNVGAILRSAAAFGAQAVIVTERHAPAATGILAKTACGGAEYVPLIPVVNMARALTLLRKAGFWCVGLAEEGAKDLAQSNIGSGRTALVLGAEGEGLRRLTRENCDELARLPTAPPIGSLNVSNAAAIALYEMRRGQK